MTTARSTTETLSLAEARRVAVHASGLDAKFPGVPEALAYLGIVQLDAIKAVGRAHELTLAERTAGLNISGVDTALWGNPGQPVAFEFWGHAASLIPMPDWPLWRFRRERTRRADIDWRPEQKVCDRLTAALEDHGPLTMRQLRGDGKSGSGWDWSPTKTAIEYLIWTGDIVCVERRGWQRVFDLPQRVVPDYLRAQEPDEHTCLVTLLEKAGRVLGIATVDDLADYLRIKRSLALSALQDTCLARVRIQNWKQQAWAHPEALSIPDGTPGTASRFVGPFDNLIWFRPRVKRLFGFEHVLEAYKPAAKRQYGYYVMPLLWDSRLVGRADMLIDGETLNVLKVFLDDDTPKDVLATAFQSFTRTTATRHLQGDPAKTTEPYTAAP